VKADDLLHLSPQSPLVWLVPLVLAVAFGLVLTPLAIRIATLTGVIDRPAGLKIHKRPTPLLGGVAVFVSFAVTVIVSAPLSGPVRGVLLGGLAAVVVGVLDEVLTLPPLAHLTGQIIAAGIAVAGGIGVIHYVSAPSNSLIAPPVTLPLLAGLVLTMFWLVGMMNTVNFLDGLDGLAPGIVSIAAVLLAIWASEPRRFALASTQPESVILPMALAGALLGFLVYNWSPAKIFLGDSGSMFLGLALGALSIVGPAKLGTALIVLIVPVLDVAWAIIRRGMRGKSFLSGDKQHVYHRMMELGLAPTRTVILLYGICVALGVVDLLLLRVWKYAAFVVLVVLLIATFAVLELRAESAVRARLPAPGSSAESYTNERSRR
jgi:UDP-GlcNAc:undecaprenyl-phosphate/decaprenyl-phosphate GlcNAc-1-phosphate transferase